MSEFATLLADATDRLLARHLPEGAAGRGTPELRAALLAALLDSGLHLALAPAEAGGSEPSLGDAAAIAWRWGWRAAPLPIVELLLGARAAALAGVEPETCAVLCDDAAPDLAAAGATFFTLGPTGPDGDTLARIEPREGDRFADLAGEGWIAPPPGGFGEAAALPLPAGTAADLRARAALLTASLVLGASTRVLEIAIDHANTRQQFGRPLGKFQAIQNLIADAASEQVATQAALDAAIVAFDRGAASDLLTFAAKAQAGRAATIVAAAAHQTLGAIGFTAEHVLGQYTRRLWDWRDRWGRQSACEAALGRAACADPRGLWRHMVD